MAKLQTLKSRLQTVTTSRVQTLAATEDSSRPRGSAWMATRQRVALAHGYKCAGCGRVWVSRRDKTDHIIPRWKGGSDDDSNLQPLCVTCHDVKTKQEAAERAKG